MLWSSRPIMTSTDKPQYSYLRWDINGWGEVETSKHAIKCDGAGMTASCPYGSPLAKYTVTRYYLCEQCARNSYIFTGAFKPTERKLRDQLTKVVRARADVRDMTVDHMLALLVGHAVGKE